ncbi:MAG: thiamine phosphate synthase [Phycisphaeraceae bacterium]|nr:thiamine phosphate synthase [Phycisphaeraceae bacterium]
MDALHRMLDANLNRAREGLRVLEDTARFALDSEALSREFKEIRHVLRDVVRAVDPTRAALLLSRDTPGDVGVAITTVQEAMRTNLHDVAAAAAARAGEALRSVEEACKALAPAAAPPVERARYRLYDAEKKLLLALGTGRGRQWRLCVIITASLCTHMDWRLVAEYAIAGGADCVQLREKGLPDGELLRRARDLVEIAKTPKPPSVFAAPGDAAAEPGPTASVIINDRADIAFLSGADGVHLGQDDLPVAEARRIGGPRLLVGVSTHNPEEARRALLDGADYAGVGAMFPSETKRRPVSGPEYLGQFLAAVERSRPMPHLAIGGITPENVGQLARAGCRGVAVSSAVCGSREPGTVCRRILEAMTAAGA